jgi:hypothetical protein
MIGITSLVVEFSGDTLIDYCLASSEQFAVIFMTIPEKTPSFVSNKFNCYFGHKGKNET